MEIQHNSSIICPKHGKVRFTATDAQDERRIRYCYICESEARNQHLHPASPYPLQGTSPSVILGCNRGD